MVETRPIRRGVGVPTAILLAASVLVGGRSAGATPIQSYDAYQSWFVACDNTLSCVAKAFSDGAESAEIDISRDAGPAAEIRVTVAAETPVSLPDLSVDGRKLGLSADEWRSERDEAGGWVATTDLAAARAFATAVRNGAGLELRPGTTIPLDGFVAAMVRLDERQGRLGGVTALLRPGPSPASRVPPPPPVPQVAHHPVKAMLAAGEDARLIARVRREAAEIFKREDCMESAEVSASEAYALDDGRALVLIPCLLGAYQGSSLAFIAPRKAGKAVRLTAAAPYGGNTEYSRSQDMFTEASFDPDTGMFSAAAKGRGMADCGFSASWIWDGTKMVLSDMSLQQSCGGLEPGDWPTLFRSRP